MLLNPNVNTEGARRENSKQILTILAQNQQKWGGGAVDHPAPLMRNALS